MKNSEDTYYCYLVSPEEYVKADADPYYRPLEHFVGTVKGGWYNQAEKRAIKLHGPRVYVSEVRVEELK